MTPAIARISIALLFFATAGCPTEDSPFGAHDFPGKCGKIRCNPATETCIIGTDGTNRSYTFRCAGKRGLGELCRKHSHEDCLSGLCFPDGPDRYVCVKP